MGHPHAEIEQIQSEALDEPADSAMQFLRRIGNQTGNRSGMSPLSRLSALAEARTAATLVRERACPSTLLALPGGAR